LLNLLRLNLRLLRRGVDSRLILSVGVALRLIVEVKNRYRSYQDNDEKDFHAGRVRLLPGIMAKTDLPSIKIIHPARSVRLSLIPASVVSQK